MAIKFDIEDILEKYSVTMYNIAYYYAKNKSDADDIFQNLCFKLIKRKPEFKSEEHKRAYVIRASINVAKSYVKGSWFKKVFLTDKELDSNDNEYNEIDEDVLSYKLKRLPEKYRIVIHLFYYEEMSIKEIGEALNLKEATVKTQLHRARKLLKEYFDEEEL